MSPNGQSRVGKIIAADNLYTIILAVALGLVLITTIVVAYKCYSQYDTIFKIP